MKSWLSCRTRSCPFRRVAPSSRPVRRAATEKPLSRREAPPPAAWPVWASPAWGRLRESGCGRCARGLASGRASAPPEAVVPVSFDGPPDGSEDHHRGPQQAAQGPRRVSQPYFAAAGAVPFPAVGRQRSTRPLFSGVPSFGTAGDPSLALRETSRHDGSLDAAPGCCPVAPPGDPHLRAAVAPAGVRARQTDRSAKRRRSTGPVRRRAARCARRGLVRLHAGISVPATALRSHFEAAHSTPVITGSQQKSF